MRKLLLVILASLLFSAPVHAAIAAGTIWELRTAGADTNGGAYVATGTDMSIFDNKNAAGCSSCQSATVNISTTDGVTAGTTTVTSVSGNYSSALIGNVVHVQGGTGSVASGWYQVITVPGATSFTVDRSTGLTAGTGVSIDIGGAILSPGIVSANAISGNGVFVKNDGTGIYSFTSATINIAGGTISNSNSVRFYGYTTTRTTTNTDAQPIFQTNVSTATQVSGSGLVFYNITFDGNSATTSKFSASAIFYRCLIKNFNTTSSASTYVIGSQITANSVSVVGTSGALLYNDVYDNTGAQNPQFAVGNVIDTESGASIEGLLNVGIAIGNSVYASGRDGISGSTVLINNNVENSGRYGFNYAATARLSINNSGYNNTTNLTNTTAGSVTPEYGLIAITAGSAFTAAGSHDFSLNNTTNQGALLRSAAYPALFPRGTTASYRDVGAAQHTTVTVGTPIGQ